MINHIILSIKLCLNVTLKKVAKLKRHFANWVTLKSTNSKTGRFQNVSLRKMSQFEMIFRSDLLPSDSFFEMIKLISRSATLSEKT